MTSLSVIVPVFNEEAALGPMAAALGPILDAHIGPRAWQFVFVDNGSSDRTKPIAQEICLDWPPSKYIRLVRPNYGEALATGLAQADGAWSYIVNVDFWDEAFLVWGWQNRDAYDLITGSKRADFTLNEQPRYRVVLSWGLNTILQLVFGFVGTDTHGQKMLKMASMAPILAQTIMRRGQFDTEFSLRALRGGLWLAEVPVPIREERKQRNLMIKKIVQNLVDIVRLRRIIHRVRYKGPIRYHRWAREDMLRAIEQADGTELRRA